jgi:hypothetical protein
MKRRSPTNNYQSPGIYHITITVRDRALQRLGVIRGDVNHQQKQACVDAAAKGAILVSARIAKGEQEIIDEISGQGHPVITVADNGFPEIYHPSQQRLDLAAANKLLILSPWKYQYRHHNEDITVAQCKTMNCVVQALCKKKDTWWKEYSKYAYCYFYWLFSLSFRKKCLLLQRCVDYRVSRQDILIAQTHLELDPRKSEDGQNVGRLSSDGLPYTISYMHVLISAGLP